MQSKATTVDDYLKEVPADRLEAFSTIRKLCLNELKGYEETMQYGMPSYEKDNIVEVGFASQKHFIALYILKLDVMNEHKEQLQGVSIGKGCIRFTSPRKINFEVIQKMLSGTALSKNSICG